MTAIEKAAAAFVAMFLKEVNYHEKATNAQLDDPLANSGSNNWNKFAAFVDSLRDLGLNFYNGRKNIGPQGEWCDINFDTVMIWFIMSLGFDKIEAAKLAMQILYQPSNSCGAGCCYSAGYYRAAGAWIERSGTPKVGDQFFIGPKYDESHTGAVAKVDATYIYTAEGNYGNQVAERKIRRDDSSIAGYGRPNFALVAKYFEEPEKPTPKYITAAESAEIAKAEIEAVDGKWVESYKNLPDWAKPEMLRLIKLGVVRGTEPVDDPEDTKIKGTVNGFVRSCIVALRLCELLMAQKPDAPESE